MGRTIRDVSAVIILTVLFAAGLKSCVVDAYKIPTASMSETIVPGDFLLVNKVVYGARTPDKIFFIPLPRLQFPPLTSVGRGDVIVFDFPGEPNEIFPVRNQFLVKRCVGLPGDTVEIANANLIINGFREEHSFSQYDTVPLLTVVPYKGMIFPLDTAVIGRWSVFIQREGHQLEQKNDTILIDGTPAATYTVGRNYYFAVGDNARNSYDSRSWGFVPEDHIIGRASMVYWSKDENGIRWERIGKIIR